MAQLADLLDPQLHGVAGLEEAAASHAHTRRGTREHEIARAERHARARNACETGQNQYGGLAFAMFEEFHLLQPLFCFLLCFVRTTEILLAVLRNNFVAAGNLLDHRAPLLLDATG